MPGRKKSIGWTDVRAGDFISFKYITDNANEQSPKDWEENCSDGIKEFKERILKEIEK